MLDVSPEQIAERLRVENPWWRGDAEIAPHYRSLKRRAYFEPFYELVRAPEPRRAVVLLGPRRVGKTVLIHHAIQQLLADGIPKERVAYVSVDHPVYNGLSLERLVNLMKGAAGWTDEVPGFVFFDEIQYLRDWERHLKRLVDDPLALKFVASGSAAAALRLKSTESGAGRFTEFALPPLTFHECLMLTGQHSLVSCTPADAGDDSGFERRDIGELNRAFVRYLNFGGYPEVLLSPEIQRDMPRFVKSDIVDKVLLRDLPSLYGISDVQELNSLFTMLAFNTAQEVSLEQLSQRSGVSKNTIKKYIEYLEAAYLIRRIHRVDQDGRHFRRATCFKVYLTNPSMRSALFAPIGPDDAAAGALVETAVFCQWFHSSWRPYYARWEKGEVDIVNPKAGPQRAPAGVGFEWAVEVKWSDRYVDTPGELREQLEFCRRNRLGRLLVTTKTRTATQHLHGVRVDFEPAAVYCYRLGRNAVQRARSGAPQS